MVRIHENNYNRKVMPFSKWERMMLLDNTPDEIAWMYSTTAQVLFELGLLREGKYGVGMGVGREPLPDLLVYKGCRVLATDQPSINLNHSQWRSLNQYMVSKEILYKGISMEDSFNKMLGVDYIDLLKIPEYIKCSKFDFVWSVDVLPYVSGIEDYSYIVLELMDALKDKGVGIHTFKVRLEDEEEFMASLDKVTEYYNTYLIEERTINPTHILVSEIIEK